MKRLLNWSKYENTPDLLKWRSICHVWVMLFYGLLSVITQQSQNYEGNKPSHKLVERFCKTERIIAEKCCKCIALTEWHVFYIRDDLSIIQEYLKKNNNFKWYDHDAILHSVHSRNPSLSISFSRQTKSKNLLVYNLFVLLALQQCAEQCAPVYSNLNWKISE